VSGIAGIFHVDGAPASPRDIEVMTGALAHRGPDGAGVWCGGSVALGHRLLHTTPESLRERQPIVHATSGRVLVADARIDNREEIAATLGVAAAPPRTDAELILLAYERWGGACPPRLVGDFAFALWDARERTLFCARDAMGVRPFYWTHQGGAFAFGSEIKALLHLPWVQRDIDPEQVDALLEWREPDRVSTLYKGVRRLPAAHALAVTRGGVQETGYWSLEPVPELRLGRETDYVEGLRDVFQEAVRARLRSAFPVAATLSGGIDSSSIVCTARRLLAAAPGPPLKTVSLVFPGLPEEDLKVIDERPYIDAVVRGGGVEPHFVRGDRLSLTADLDRLLWHVDEAFAAPNLYLHWGMYKAAHGSGARVFLDGFDGDSALSHGFGRLNGLARAGRWDAFEAEVRAFAEHRGIPPQRVLRDYGLPYLAELAWQRRPVTWVRTASELWRRFRPSRRQMFTRYGARPLLHRGDRIQAATERESHRRGISQPLYQLALELADKASRAFGLEPRYPFFDRRLIEFCYAVPEEHKFAHGWPRFLFRRAMEGILPPEVQWRADKGDLSPNLHSCVAGVDRATILLALTRPVLDAYVDRQALEEVRERYFGGAGRGSDSDCGRLLRAAVLSVWLSTSRSAVQSPYPGPNTLATDGVV
jgi:asparagine synthase (glutamine-hydrolysing)